MSAGLPNAQGKEHHKPAGTNALGKGIATQPGNSSKTYVILRNLGEGSFGKVKEAMHVATQEKIAVKVIEKDKVVTEDDDTRVRREISIMRRIKHPNIVQLYEVIETEKYHFMVMEYVEGGELADYIETRDRVG
jgi:5'-AMP-activated protein kinase, catalytic alpha subunit